MGTMVARLEMALDERERWRGVLRGGEGDPSFQGRPGLLDKVRARVAESERRVVRLEAWEALREATGVDPSDSQLTCMACWGTGRRGGGRDACSDCEGTGVPVAPELPGGAS